MPGRCKEEMHLDSTKDNYLSHKIVSQDLLRKAGSQKVLGWLADTVWSSFLLKACPVMLQLASNIAHTHVLLS